MLESKLVAAHAHAPGAPGHNSSIANPGVLSANNKSPDDGGGLDTAIDVIDSLGDLSNASSEVFGYTGLGLMGEGAQKDASSGGYLGTSAMGLTSSILGIISNSKKYGNYKSDRKKAATRMRIGASSVDVLSNLVSGASGLSDFGYFAGKKKANDEGTKEYKNAGIMDAVAGGLGLVSSVVNFIADQTDANAHGDIADKAGQRHVNLPNNANYATPQDKASAKAKHYAMKQAQDIHGDKSGNFLMRARSALTGMSSLGMVLSGIGKATGGNSTLSLLGTIANGIGIASNVGYRIYDKFAGSKKKNEVIDEYLNDKATKIQAEAANMQLNQQEQADIATTDTDDGNNGMSRGTAITIEEAKRIAILRLGVNVDSNADINSSSVRDEVFKAITTKRANYIWNANQADKDNMLRDLGLPTTATFDEIYNVLSGDAY